MQHSLKQIWYVVHLAHFHPNKDCYEYVLNHLLLFNFAEFFLGYFCNWLFATKWQSCLQGLYLTTVSALWSLIAWPIVLSPTIVPDACGTWLTSILDQHIIGLPTIIVSTSFLLEFYAMMLSCTTQLQTLCIYIQYFYQIS